MTPHQRDADALVVALLKRRRKMVDSFLHKAEPSLADLQLFAAVDNSIALAISIASDEADRELRAAQQAELGASGQ